MLCIIVMQDLFAQLDWRGWITIVVLIVVFAFLVKEVFSPDITLLGGACVLVILGIISPAEFLRGFSRDIVFVFGMLFIVARAIYTNGILSIVAKRALPKTGGYRRKLASLMVPVGASSAFLNNTPIVLMLTGVVREWAIGKGEQPSKYLMPLSQAAIFGGMCTLIGTASNLLVDGLLRQTALQARFGFFELALIGLPCAVVGFLYVLTVGCKLLPERGGSNGGNHSEREFGAEFLIEEGCPYIGRVASEVFGQGDSRVVQAGDRVSLVVDVSEFAKLHATPGMRSLLDKEFQLELTSPHVAEAVVAVGSDLVGKTIKQATFRSRFGASVVAIYRQDRRLGLDTTHLMAGDILLLISNQEWIPPTGRDLYPLKDSEHLPVFVPRRAGLVMTVLVAMIIAITAGLPLLYSTLGAAALLLVTRCITVREAVRGIDWHLLLLVAAAFPFGSALLSTGVADFLGRGLLTLVGKNPYLIVGGLFLITMIVTEFITNTAAALLLFPIALETVILAGYNSITAIKAMGVTIAIASTSSFLTPIGYQTNTIVYGPGGYKFVDYMKVGFGLTILQLILGTLLIPTIWPLSA